MFFAPSSFWNTPLAPDAPVHPKSAAMVTDLVRQSKLAAPCLNTTQYTTAIYTVDANAPTVTVTLDGAYKAMQDQWLAVPMPNSPTISNGTDQNLVVWQPDTNTMWEFWHLRKLTDGWHARWGGRMQNVTTNPGWFPAPFGASATGLPLAGGLILIEEAQAGSINHALSVAIPQATKGTHVWPAQRHDGAYNTPIPEGTRFRLDPALNIEALNLYPLTKMMAYAAQRYGIVVRDQAGAIAFVGEQPKDPAVNPWPRIFAGVPGWKTIPQFPFAKLQALA